MTDYDVTELEDLIRPYLGPNQRICGKDVVKLPQAGFGSVMLKITLTVREDDGPEEKVHVVAKILPNSEMARQMFNVQVTFKNEVAFYSTIVPLLDQFQRDNGSAGISDMFAKFYGARISLDGSSGVVNDDAVLLMENLYEQGFVNIDRKKGFDLEGAKFVLNDMARLHGTTIALRLKQSWLFEKKVKATCKEFKFEPSDDFDKSLKVLLQENPECAPYASHVGKFSKMNMPPAREPFAALVHNDMWVNNTMQKIVDGKIVANKFVDFQAYHYRCCVSDVFFFIFTSVQLDVLMDHLDDLFAHYHGRLLDVLRDFGIDLKPFSYGRFMEEVKIEADFEYSHALVFLCIVKGFEIPERLDEGQPTPEDIVKNTPLSLKEHLWFLTTECVKRGWVQ